MDKNETLVRVARAKKSRRKELSQLSFKKKIEILVKLQDMAKGVKKHSVNKKGHIWVI